MEISNLALLGTVLLTFFASIIVHIILTRALIRHGNAQFATLDSNLATSLKNLVENLPEMLGDLPDIEPPNPFQALLMQIVQEKMNPQVKVTEVTQGSDGKFIKK